MRRLFIVALALAGFAAAPTVKHMQLTVADKESEFPAMVYNGSQLGVAWMDGRDGNQEIYFRTADMDIKDKGQERRITNSPDWDDHPRLCWTGTEFGLVFIHESKSKFSLLFTTLDPSGNPKRSPRSLVGQANLGKDTAICWTGAGYGIVYALHRGTDQADLVYKYVDETGKQVGNSETLTSGPGIKVPGDLVRLGGSFSLVYLNSGDGNVYLLDIDPFGKPKGEARRLNIEGTRCKTPAAAAGKDGALVAWPQETTDGSQIIALALSDVGLPAGTPHPLTQPGSDRPVVAVAAGSGGYGVAWMDIGQEGRSLFFDRLDASGMSSYDPVRLSKPRPVPVISNNLAIATDATGFVIAWVDVAPPVNTEVILSRVSF